MKQGNISEDRIAENFVTFFIAGSDTSALTMTSAMYFLGTYPDKMKKVREELKNHGFFNFDDLNSAFAVDNINSLDYLTYVIKETLRLDGPAMESLKYKTYEDVVICGVPIPKGVSCGIHFYTDHFDDREYKNVHEFIPERFDPESDYYLKPGENKGRRSTSWTPFSQGSRKCPGQSFAMLEMKVALAYLLSHIEYEIDPEIKKYKQVGFTVGSDHTMKLKITALTK
jgi:cholesterol 24(S)-hydroxylase